MPGVLARHLRPGGLLACAAAMAFDARILLQTHDRVVTGAPVFCVSRLCTPIGVSGLFSLPLLPVWLSLLLLEVTVGAAVDAPLLLLATLSALPLCAAVDALSVISTSMPHSMALPSLFVAPVLLPVLQPLPLLLFLLLAVVLPLSLPFVLLLPLVL